MCKKRLILKIIQRQTTLHVLQARVHNGYKPLKITLPHKIRALIYPYKCH